ncbi:hypothetical protein MMC13_004966 [Lambiella insularis]|nr:hypothetical protein [Lambiella insularis]
MSLRNISGSIGYRGAEAYGLTSDYTLNPIRLPPPQQQSPGLPSLLQEPGLPYCTSQHKSSPHDTIARIPPTYPEKHGRELAISQNNGNRKDDIERPRACEACRGLKVRCVPDFAKGSCRRCAKAGRQCVVTLPSRKRQKKTDTRVAELERKIDALTASLQAGKTVVPSDVDDESFDEEHTHDASKIYQEGVRDHLPSAAKGTEFWAGPKEPPTPISPKPSSLKRKKTRPSDKVSEGTSELASPTRSVARENEAVQRPTTETAVTFENDTYRSTSSSSRPVIEGPGQVLSIPDHEYADVVDRKIIDADTAARIFDHYTNTMTPHMPAVVFPPTTSSGEIRRTKPILFLAILSVASYRECPKLQKILHKEITRVYADSIICKGERSLELIQALQVSSIWFSPEDYKDAKPYQLIHMAVSMAFALGLSQQKKFCTGLSTNPWKEQKYTRDAAGGGHVIERRRAWVACFSLSGIAAAGLKLPNLLRWSPYLDDCVHALEASSEALQSDRILCHSAKLQQLRDDLMLRFESDVASPALPLSISGQHKELMTFLKRIEDLESQRPKDVYCPSLIFAYNVTYMHVRQIDVRIRYNIENLNPFNELADPPSSSSNSGVAKTSEIDPVLDCLKALHRVLDGPLSFTVEEVRTMPTFNFLRVAFAVVSLVRLHRAVMNPNSNLSKVIPIQNVDVETYVKRLLVNMQQAAADGMSRPAQSFQMALRMILTWSKRNFDGPSAKHGERSSRFVKLEVQPVDTDRTTPRLGYRKISVPVDKKSRSSTPREQPKLRTPSITISEQQTGQTQTQATLPRHPEQSVPFNGQYTNRIPMGNTPLDLLSHVATSDASSSVLHLHNNGSQEPWYNNNYPAQIAPGPDSTCVPYSTWQDVYPNQPAYLQDYTDNVDMYQGMHADAGLDPAINVTFGEEGDLFRMFMDPFANSSYPVHSTEPFNDWPSGE